MRQIERGQDTYGEGSSSEQAVQFYLDQLLEEVVRRARDRSDLPDRPVQLLISLVGFSPTVPVLVYELLRPQRLLVIASAQAKASVDVIADRVVGPGRLRPRDFVHRSCDPTDPLGIYRIVKDLLGEMQDNDGDRPVGVIDITGGRKVMSATAALAAWQLELELCYVNTDFDPELRQPVPGSDRLLLLSNPTTLFGEQEMRGALEMFANGAFDAAHRRYAELSDRLGEPTRARFMRTLSGRYRDWCDLNLDELPAQIESMEAALQQSRRDVTQATASRIQRQLRFLRSLPSQEHNRLLCFYLLGLHYAEVVRRLDFAALLFYRTIEGCLAQRLERRFSGFSCSQPDYALVTADVDGLAQRFDETMRKLNPRQRRLPLPPTIGAMSAAVLLFTLEDDLLASAEQDSIGALKNLRGLLSARNDSVLAHGFSSVGPDDSARLQARALVFLRGFWQLHGDQEDVDQLCNELRFVRSGI